MLEKRRGHPDDPSDDCAAYEIDAKLPQPGSGWKSYTFKVPSGRATLPPGWVIRGSCGGLTQNDAWESVITNVTRVTFPFADANTLWYFQIWDLGIDSVRIPSRSGRTTGLEPDVPE